MHITIGDLLGNTKDIFYDSIRIYANERSDDPLMTFDDEYKMPRKINKLEFYSWSIDTVHYGDDKLIITIYLDS